MMLRPSFLVFPVLLLLAGCDQIANRLGLEDPVAKDAKIDGEGRAVGSGCRQSGRAIEDCYAIYDRLPKAAIFAGWREMNDYMIANKLEVVEPKLPPPGTRKKKAEASEEKKPEDAKSDGKDPAKADAKPDGKDAATKTAKGAEQKPAKPDAKGDAKPDAKADAKPAGKP